MPRTLLPFELLEPNSVEEVLKEVDGQSAVILAGGVDLVLKLRLRKWAPKKVVSIQRVAGLDYIESAGALKFGALLKLHDLERSPAVKETWPLLAEALSTFVSMQTKSMGTVVGNLCVGTPASDVAPALFAYDAMVTISGLAGTREVPIEDFFVGPGKTVVGAHEMVTAIEVPRPKAGTTFAFGKLLKTAEDIAKVNAAVTITMMNGVCTDARIALGSVAPTPIRVREAEETLKGAEASASLFARAAAAAADAAAPISDIRSTAGYRKRAVEVLVRDALATAHKRARA